MAKVFKVYISPSKGNKEISSWKDKIEEMYGPLSGYVVDLKNKDVKDILLDILKYKGDGMAENQNYLNIRGIYLEHVKSLQKDLNNEDSTLKKEIDTLNSSAPSSKTVDILIKYGILSGIEFFIPYEKIYHNYDDLMGDNVFKGVDAESPYKKYWDETFRDANYTPAKEVPFKYTDMKLAVQVLIYSKASFNQDTKSFGKLYDITNFISSISTSVNKTSGGNFNIKMHLVSVTDLESGSAFQNHNLNITGYTKALFLQSLFRENDLVFIRFEKLKIEGKNSDEEGDNSKEKSNKKQIKGKYWDMIGLIDTNTIMSDYNSLNITITGRDLIKLVIDDNNIFIPYQWANCPETIFGGKNSKVFRRLYESGEYVHEFIYAYKSIENSLGFIFSQLTHIEVLSTDCVTFLENEYGNDLAKQYEYTDVSKNEKKEKIKGIWGLVNFYVDEKISSLRLADASLKSPDGSTMQQILKICQEPFVELIADTFVDKYNFIARKPPFAVDDIYKSNFLVIGRDSCISDNLNFSREIYTVYQLTPQGGCFADNNSIASAYLPMIVLDDYTRLWGNKLYSQVYNYINIDLISKVNIDEKKNQKNAIEYFIEDLIWLIQSTAYLPFSRTGQITIKGDRRIKVGQWIYYEKSNEVFYVDSVSHSASIIDGGVDRVTTLNVSRGLVKDYIKPVKKDIKEKKSGKEKSVSNVSYADLIDTDVLRDGLKSFFLKINKVFNIQKEVKKEDKFESNTTLVIPEVFNFFLSGAQFEGKVTPYTRFYNHSAMNLSEINREQGRAGNRAGYSMSISVSHSDGVEGSSQEQEIKVENDSINEIKKQPKGEYRRMPDGGKLIFVPYNK